MLPLTRCLCFHEEEECQTVRCIRASNKFNEYIDRSIDPCDNFYDFVCGNFKKTYNKIYSISTPIEEFLKRIALKLNSVLEQPMQANDSNSAIIAKQLFASCTNINRTASDDKIVFLMEKLGGWPVTKSQWNDKNFSWQEISIKARKLGLQYDWFFNIDISKYSAGEPQLSYPKELKRVDPKYRQYYLSLMIEIAVHFGAQKSTAEEQMLATLNFEDSLATIVEGLSKDGDDFNLEPIHDLQNKIPQVNWLALFHNITMTQRPILDEYKIYNEIENYFEKFEGLIELTPKKIQANYFIWKLIESLAPFLSTSLRSKFQIYHVIVHKQAKSRPQTCTQWIHNNMRSVLEGLYVQKFTNQDLISNVNDFIDQIKIEMIRKIEENSWLDEESKKRTITKTKGITYMIGGPDYLFNTKILEDFWELDKFRFGTKNILEMVIELQLHTYRTKFNKLFDSKADASVFRFQKEIWVTINGRYMFQRNILMLTAGILQDDFYSSEGPKFLNYGGLGSVISHELSHSFDFADIYHMDPITKELIQWITYPSLEMYIEKLTCILVEHDEVGHTSSKTEHIRENLADFIAIDLAYRAYQSSLTRQGYDYRLPGLEFTPNQLFWIQAASFMCFQPNVNSLVDLEDDVEVHSQPVFRVVGPLRSSKYFAKDFKCAENSYMNPTRKCDLI